jgi:hypothetical protein
MSLPFWSGWTSSPQTGPETQQKYMVIDHINFDATDRFAEDSVSCDYKHDLESLPQGCLGKIDTGGLRSALTYSRIFNFFL